MLIRNASLLDAPQLAALNKQLNLDEGYRIERSLASLEARMRQWLSSDYRAIVLDEDGQLRAYLLFRHETEYLYLRQLFVQANYRRSGHASALLRALSEFDTANCIRIDVLVQNINGRAFWQAMGFEEYCITMEKQTALTKIT